MESDNYLAGLLAERGVSMEEVVGLGDQVFSVCLDVFPASVYL